jgi:hypothetical protein
MRSLAERLLDLASALEAATNSVGAKSIEDVRLAARFVEMKDGDQHPLKGVPTLAEERIAWDRYAAAAIAPDNYGPSDAARVADAILEERRKRFGAGK